MQEEGREQFWKEALLGAYADDCVCHIILPTIMTTKLRKPIDMADARLARAQRDNMTCCFCNVFLGAGGELAKVGVRFVLGMCPAMHYPDSEDMTTRTPGFLYRARFGRASICMQCTAAKQISVHIDSNSAMIDEMYYRLDAAAEDTAEANFHHVISGPDFLAQVLGLFHVGYDSFMTRIGAMDTSCEQCKAKNPPKCCSRCRYTRYCGPGCSIFDWPKHKVACKYLSRKQFFIRPLTDRGDGETQ